MVKIESRKEIISEELFADVPNGHASQVQRCPLLASFRGAIRRLPRGLSRCRATVCDMKSVSVFAERVCPHHPGVVMRRRRLARQGRLIQLLLDMRSRHGGRAHLRAARHGKLLNGVDHEVRAAG